jgi:hypothetical protein
MKSHVVTLVGIVLAAVLLVASPATAGTDQIDVVGGGLANSEDVAGLTSYFGVLARIQEEGDTTGQFNYAITNYMIMSGKLTNSTVNEDGSVKMEGISDIFLVQTGDVMEDVPYSVVVWPGGPQTGRLLMHLADITDPGDSETVFVGSIQIIKH